MVNYSIILLISTSIMSPMLPLLQRLKQNLQHTRQALTEKLSSLFLGQKVINPALLESLETVLLSADISVSVTHKIMDLLTAQISRKQLNDASALYAILEEILLSLLLPYEKPLDIDLPENKNTRPFVILFIGINGAGKTTSIGKLAQKLTVMHKKVLLAAGDTFRAAAVQQLQIWGERHHIPVIAQPSGADSAAVIFDAMTAAKARHYDVLLIDTAGRLHTQNHLIDELKKVKRVMARADQTAPHETLLVLDASIGQNALSQAKQFHEALNVTGLIITKLDGTAKGGAIFSITEALNLPIRFIGMGESVDDMAVFDAKAFIQALLS